MRKYPIKMIVPANTPFANGFSVLYETDNGVLTVDVWTRLSGEAQRVGRIDNFSKLRFVKGEESYVETEEKQEDTPRFFGNPSVRNYEDITSICISEDSALAFTRGVKLTA